MTEPPNGQNSTPDQCDDNIATNNLQILQHRKYRQVNGHALLAEILLEQVEYKKSFYTSQKGFIDQNAFNNYFDPLNMMHWLRSGEATSCMRYNNICLVGSKFNEFSVNKKNQPSVAQFNQTLPTMAKWMVSSHGYEWLC